MEKQHWAKKDQVCAQSGFRPASAQSTNTELLSLERGESIPTIHPTNIPALLSHFIFNYQ